MPIDSINYLAILVAAIAAFIWGAIWYMSLSKPWMAAMRFDPAKAAERGRSIQPFIISAIGLLIMAAVLSMLISIFADSVMQPVSLQFGLMVGFVCWVGFILTTLAVNQRYQGYSWTLTIIDGLHWLGVVLIIGAILGWWNAPAAEVPAA